MKKINNRLIVFATLIIIVQLILIDYKNLSLSNNVGNYLGILSMIFVIIAMVLSNRNDAIERD